MPDNPVSYIAFRRLRGNPGPWEATDIKGVRSQVLSQISDRECQESEQYEYFVVPKGEKPGMFQRQQYRDRMMRPGG